MKCKFMKPLIVTFLVIFVSQNVFSQKIENRLAELKIILPKVQPPIASYVNAVRTGNLIYLSGKGPTSSDGKFISGKVGVDLTLEEGKAAARNTGLNLLAALKAEIGDLDKVKRIVKVLGMVNCPTDFTQQPQVINGFSDLMVEVLGDKGKHARSAIGVGSLPANMAVEIEMIVEVE
jgi:enamine deaminase RidA (YjgF/YER057c/UK114 family)